MQPPYWGLLCPHHGEEIRRLRPTVIPPHVWETGWISHFNHHLAKVNPIVADAVTREDVAMLNEFAPSCCRLTEAQMDVAVETGWAEVFAAVEQEEYNRE